MKEKRGTQGEGERKGKKERPLRDIETERGGRIIRGRKGG